MPQYEVALDSSCYVVLAKFTAKQLRTRDVNEAKEFAEQMTSMGYEVVSYVEYDTIAKPIALLPLEAESLKQKQTDKC